MSTVTVSSREGPSLPAVMATVAVLPGVAAPTASCDAAAVTQTAAASVLAFVPTSRIHAADACLFDRHDGYPCAGPPLAAPHDLSMAAAASALPSGSGRGSAR